MGWPTRSLISNGTMSLARIWLETLKGLHMPSSQLKRAERAIQAIRDQAALPPEAADALQELVDIVRTIEDRVSTLEKAKVVLT
jgi:uncharacterized membrane protein YccC